MATYAPRVRHASARKAHVRVVSVMRWRLDRAPRVGTRRHLGTDRTRQGAVYGGPGSLVIDLAVDGVPARRHVRVLAETSGELLRDGYTDPVTGLLTFTGLPLERAYTVIAYDDQGEYQAQLWDNVRASP